MTTGMYDCRTRQDAATRSLSRCLRRALGLAPAATHVSLQGGILAVRLTHALTPMSRMIVGREAGAQIVQGAYEALLADCREELARLAAQMTGAAVRQMRISVDARTEAVLVEFVLQREGEANA